MTVCSAGVSCASYSIGESRRLMNGRPDTDIYLCTQPLIMNLLYYQRKGRPAFAHLRELLSVPFPFCSYPGSSGMKGRLELSSEPWCHLLSSSPRQSMQLITHSPLMTPIRHLFISPALVELSVFNMCPAVGYESSSVCIASLKGLWCPLQTGWICQHLYWRYKAHVFSRTCLWWKVFFMSE